MRKRNSDPSLPVIEESSNVGAAADENEDDAEDREEQLLFDRDNAAAEEVSNVDDDGEEDEIDRNVSNTAPENADSNGPIYVQSATSGDKWELSWPIWHMLPRNERRAIAIKHGYKTIGEFEEYMSLTRAVDESEGRVQERSGIIALPSLADEHTNINDGISALSISESTDVVQNSDWHPPFANPFANEEDDDSSVSSTEDISNFLDSTPTAAENIEIDLEIHLENIKMGGLPCQLPDEILHKCFSYISVDDHAPLALVSPHWSRFTRCEAVYKALCERVYLNQSKRKALHVSRFGSYRNMLEIRPRLRTGGGLYVLKYQEVRKIQRDMWTEIPLGAVLESVYFRYMYFFEDGRVMYALTHATPLEMIPRFKRMLIHGYGSKDKWGVWGTYQLRKDEVVVKVSHDWHDVCFQLRVIPSNKVLCYDSGDKGMYTTIQLEKHLSSAVGDFEEDRSPDLVNYDVPPSAYFRFLRDRRL
jgi:F-box protein 9